MSKDIGRHDSHFWKREFQVQKGKKTVSEVLHWDWRSPCELRLFGMYVCVYAEIDRYGCTYVVPVQLVVPVMRARSRKDWLMAEGHTESLEGAPTGTYWG